MDSSPVLITQDRQLQNILKLVRQVARFGSNLLITGESGTGKDLVAQYYHCYSKVRSGPFIKVDCTAVPEDLIESELFGHEKGAFSGAISQRLGRFERAHNGTLFIDQIEEIPSHIQPKLTRIIQEKTFERLGGNQSIYSNVQIVSSTKVSLDFRVKEGMFREDLYYRLSIMPITLPPLRSRRGDIPLLIKYFLDKFAEKHNRSAPKLHPDALTKLCEYNWPGNIREVENLIERLIISSQSNDEIQANNLQLEPLLTADDSLESFVDKEISLELLEKEYIRRILQKTRGNKSIASKILGINRKTLLEKRRKYNLE